MPERDGEITERLSEIVVGRLKNGNIFIRAGHARIEFGKEMVDDVVAALVASRDS